MTLETLNTTPQHKPDKHGHIPGTATLEASKLTVSYETTRVLDDVTFVLNHGERLAVLGPNGAGKSTLFKVISGVMKPDRGEVRVYGAEPRGHICIAYLPQRSQVDWNFPVTVFDVVLMGRTGKLGLLHWPGHHDHELAHTALEAVGLQDLAHRQISQLSGGQQQRMFIARAIAQEAELMLLDEPFTGLDIPSQENLFAALDLLKSRNVTVLLALHDLKLASEHFDRLMLLNHRLIALGKPEDVITEANLKQAYGERVQVIAKDREVSIIDDTCCGEEGHTHA
jgi:manganese/iron transport system ATP-binding protein